MCGMHAVGGSGEQNHHQSVTIHTGWHGAHLPAVKRVLGALHVLQELSSGSILVGVLRLDAEAQAPHLHHTACPCMQSCGP